MQNISLIDFLAFSPLPPPLSLVTVFCKAKFIRRTFSTTKSRTKVWFWSTGVDDGPATLEEAQVHGGNRKKIMSPFAHECVSLEVLRQAKTVFSVEVRVTVMEKYLIFSQI